MIKLLLTIFCAVIPASSIFSQPVKNVAPVEWKNYKNTEQNFSIAFPKLPVKLESGDNCRQIDELIYYAFAADVVYELKVFRKADSKIPTYCPNPVKFTDKTFGDRLNSLQSQENFSAEDYTDIGGKRFIRLERKSDSVKTVKWLLNDFKNKRWFELSTTAYAENSIDGKDFAGSLKLLAGESDVKLNDGSPVVLGDDLTGKPKLPIVLNGNDSGHSSPLTIVVKARPRYTSAARKNNTVGSVRVRVTFLPDGSIGSVTPVTELENGLTQEAVDAARKMAFLPQRQKDVKVTVTKAVVFTFTIY